MKLIVAGACGFVTTEVIRQSLARTKITEVIALACSRVSAPEYLPAEARAKLKSAVVEDYDKYSDEFRKQVAGADACIWFNSHVCRTS